MIASKLDSVALLVEDHFLTNCTPMQNKPCCKPPPYIAIAFWSNLTIKMFSLNLARKSINQFVGYFITRLYVKQPWLHGGPGQARWGRSVGWLVIDWGREKSRRRGSMTGTLLQKDVTVCCSFNYLSGRCTSLSLKHAAIGQVCLSLSVLCTNC